MAVFPLPFPPHCCDTPPRGNCWRLFGEVSQKSSSTACPYAGATTIPQTRFPSTNVYGDQRYLCLQLIRTSTGPGSNLLWQICQFVDCRSSRTPGFGKLYLGRLRASLVSQTCADLLRLATAATVPVLTTVTESEGAARTGPHMLPRNLLGGTCSHAALFPPHSRCPGYYLYRQILCALRYSMSNVPGLLRF